jgi:hypothetical protein
LRGRAAREKRHPALLELLVTRFYTALLRKKQDQIAGRS